MCRNDLNKKHIMSSHVPGPENNMDIAGSHASRFLDRIGKTHFSGVRVAPGNIWQAKGQLHLLMYVIVTQ